MTSGFVGVAEKGVDAAGGVEGCGCNDYYGDCGLHVVYAVIAFSCRRNAGIPVRNLG